MRYYPINVDIQHKECVVIGGGNVAHRKASALLKAGARIRLISPDIKEELKNFIDDGSLTWQERKYEEGDLKGAALAFVAVNDRKVGEKAAIEAAERNILINVADIPEQCTFTLPSYLERGDLLITISTGGRCPALARHMRLRLEELVEDEYGIFLDILADARERLIRGGIGHDKCKELLNKLLTSDILSLIKKGKETSARDIAEMTVTEAITE